MLISDTYYAYVSDIIKLVRSFVIKSTQTINTINSYLAAGGDELSINPADWKYYRNIAGLPYVGTTGYLNDPNIQVYSLDTNELINFLPDIIIQHPITLTDLLTYGTSYNNLITQYPNQDMLIRGVLSPVDIQTAIDADNYILLDYDPSFIGAGETRLISDIQKWITNYTTRWDVVAYAVTDNLYTAAFLGILYQNLIPVIINIRLNNCKTPQVHEFHLWNYLSNYFDLGSYKNVIPYEQAYFLYRNIEYIVANAGLSSTLDFLNDNFAFPFGLQLYKYDIRQDIGQSLKTLDNKDYKNLGNEVKVNRYPYNTPTQVTDTTKFFTIPDLVDKLESQASLNPQNIDIDVLKLEEALLHTPSTDIPTNVIEGSIIQNTTIALVSRVSEQIHNWLYLASTNQNKIRYKYILKLPSEGIPDITLSAADAAVFLMYAASAYTGNKLIDIPTPVVRDIMVHPQLTDQEILAIIESRFVSGSILNTNPLVTWNRFQDLLSAQTYPHDMITLDQFNIYIDQIVSNKVQHRLLPTLEQNPIGRSELQSLVNLFYQNIPCSFVEETTYTDFFHRLEVDVSYFSDTTFISIATTLAKVFIGISPNTSTLQSPYIEMMGILRTLCSYMVQFVNGAPTNDIEPIPWEFSIVNSKEGATVLSPIETSHGLDVNDNLSIVSNIRIPVIVNSSIDITNTYMDIITRSLNIGLDIGCGVICNDEYRIEAGAFLKLI